MFDTGKCGCGKDVRYSMLGGKGSCNKYQRCLTWEEQDALIKTLTVRVSDYKTTLGKIVEFDAKDYQYKAWATEVLDKHNGGFKYA